MDYNELIQRIKYMTLHELQLLKDTLVQKINMVYQSSHDDPESVRADLKDQLNAVLQEIQIRIANGIADINPKDPDAPIVTQKSTRPVKTVTVRLTTRNVIIIAIVAYILYKMIK